MTMVTEKVKSTLISQFAQLRAVPSYLGPVPTTNITYLQGVTYESVIGYGWESNCQPTTEIAYTVEEQQNAWMVNFTFPDGTVHHVDAWEGDLYLWSHSQQYSKTGIPVGTRTTYFVATDALSETASMPNDTSALNIVNGTWISLVKCSPSLNWSVFSCTWNGTYMTDCHPNPNANTTALDIQGLAALDGYISAAVWSLYIGDEYFFGMRVLEGPLMENGKSTSDHQLRTLTLSDYDNIYGLVAQSIATIASSGSYGSAVVTTIGEPVKSVYVVRTYILAIVVAIFCTVTLLSIADIAMHLLTQRPIRRATLLAIANAMRGPWWDKELFGGCVMEERALRRRHAIHVMFGVDAMNYNHVGLVPRVFDVVKGDRYCGLDQRVEGEEISSNEARPCQTRQTDS